MLALLLLAMGGLVSATMLSGDEEETATNSDPEGGADGSDQAETEFVTLSEFFESIHVSGTEGTVNGTERADEIIIDSQPGHPGGHLEDLGFGDLYYDATLVEIDANDGADQIIVESGGAIISTGDGADTVDAHGMDAGVIFAGSGDLVLGSDIESAGYQGTPQVGVVAHGAVFEGGAAAEFGVALGDGAQMSGNGGNDILHAYEGDAILNGGEGNDTLLGNASPVRFGQDTRVTNVDTMSNSSLDTLIGGDGDDLLELSRGDLGTGGDGEDIFRVFANDDDLVLNAATITDFSPSEDSLVIQVGGGDPWDYHDPSYDLADRVSYSDDGVTTSVIVDGEIVANIEGVTELSIGFPDHSSLSEHGAPVLYVNSETGEIEDITSFDIIVMVFHSQST